MSVEAMAIALHHSRASGTAKVVLIGIANHAGDGGSWPAVATLARYANVHPRKVQEAITRLEQLGEVRRETQAGGTAATRSHRRPNLYHFTLVCPPECDRSTAHRLRVPISAPVPNSAPVPLPISAPEPSLLNQDYSSSIESSPDSYAHAVVTDDLPSTRFLEKWAARAGILDVPALVAHIEKHTQIRVSGDRAIGIAQHLLDKAARPPRAPQRYVLAAIAQSPADVEQHILSGGAA